MRLCATVSLLLLCSFVVDAAGNGPARQSSDNVATLRTGQKIRVQTTHEGIRKGTFQLFTANSVTIHTKGRDMEIPRGEIRTIKRPSGSVRLRHTQIGAGIGAAVGAAIAIPNINEGYASYVAVAASLLTLAGSTVAGAVLPAYKTVYEVTP